MRMNLKVSEPMKDYLHFSVPSFLIITFQFLLMYTDLLLVWCGVLLWEALTKTPLPVERKWPLYFGAFVVASFFNWRKEVLRARTAEATLATERKRRSPVRLFAEHSESLLERYAHRGVLAEKLLAPYLNKWIRVSGRFEGAADSLLGDAIFMSVIRENGQRIQLCFSTERRDRLRLLQEGEQIVAVCQIHHGYGAGVFTLENCEFASAQPFRPAFARVS
jgi:hypothetical protein